MGKFTRWYNDQNETTKAWLDNQQKQENQLILASMAFGFVIGVIFSPLFIWWLL
jgi:uncharacterized Tic20 family protein